MDKSEALSEQAKRILADVIYITLATVSDDGQPWNTPVYAAPDAQYNFYWTSSPHAQHSRNINANGRVFVVVYDSTQKEGTGMGVYMKGRAQEMTEAGKSHAFYRSSMDERAKQSGRPAISSVLPRVVSTNSRRKNVG